MRALRSCDFCADDAVGAFEIVPPELEPTEAEQRRVVCCPDCRDRLETLLEPLLARAGAETDPDADVEPDMADAEALDATDDESTADESVLATVDDSTATRSRTASSNATVSDGAAGPSADSNAGDAEPTRTEDESDAASSLEEGITFERDEYATDKETTADAEPAAGAELAADAKTTDTETADAETVAADSTAATGTADAADADDQSESDTDSDDGDSTSASTRPPATYSKVIRLLRNREFPMERSDVEALAAGAYDLESHEVEAIIDYAVEDGEFVEKRGALRRP